MSLPWAPHVWKSVYPVSGLFTNGWGVFLWVTAGIVPLSVPPCHFPHPDPCHLPPEFHQPPGPPSPPAASPQHNPGRILLPDFASQEFMSKNLFLIEIWARVHLYIRGKKLPRKVRRKELPFAYRGSIFSSFWTSRIAEFHRLWISSRTS